MELRYNYRIYPTKSQEVLLSICFGHTRYIWNHFLKLNMDLYEKEKKFMWYNEASSNLTQFKKDATVQWLNDAPSQALQQTIKDLCHALKQCSKSSTNQKGFPRFKNKRQHNSFRLVQQGTKQIADNKVYIPKVGDVKIKVHRELPSDFSTASIYKKNGKYYYSVVVRKEIENIPKTGKSIGIDFNSKEIITSDNERISVPKKLKEKEKRLKKYQRMVSRRQKGSNNRKKAKTKLAKYHEKIANFRDDWCHKTALDVVKQNDTICLEDLDVKQMQQSCGRMIQDGVFSKLRHYIEYKSTLYGKQTIIINRYEPSSKTCHQCGYINLPIPLHIRSFKCASCGHKDDRDLNAALNILKVGVTAGTAGTLNACYMALKDNHNMEDKMPSISQEASEFTQW